MKAIIFLLASFIFCEKATFLHYQMTPHLMSVTKRLHNDIVIIPLGGNTWRSIEGKSGGNVTNDGIVEWTDKEVYFTAYVRFSKKGILKLGLTGIVPEGKSELQIGLLNQVKKITIAGKETRDYDVGEWTISDTGYVAVTIKGISKTGSRFADLRSLQLEGSAVDERTAFVKNNNGNFFYWGRRGPSVHLNYAMPDSAKAEWFYNEVTVPKGQDVIGSYFMADGFAEGYFGMQVNSSSERRILFSVWSPFQTNHPEQIPEDQKIQLLKKGDEVHAGEFGNEGSGGQSYLRYNWKAGTTYKFLLHGLPDGSGNTTYTAYFFAPEKNKWMLIASFKRPHTHTYLKRLHSFLENFEPESGNIERTVMFTNQWIKESNGQWLELNRARFTGDNTAVKKYRMDYGGGVTNGAFYLHNCGFFNNYTPLNTWCERPLSGRQPNVQTMAL